MTIVWMMLRTAHFPVKEKLSITNKKVPGSDRIPAEICKLVFH